MSQDTSYSNMDNILNNFITSAFIELFHKPFNNVFKNKLTFGIFSFQDFPQNF